MYLYIDVKIGEHEFVQRHAGPVTSHHSLLVTSRAEYYDAVCPGISGTLLTAGSSVRLQVGLLPVTGCWLLQIDSYEIIAMPWGRLHC